MTDQVLNVLKFVLLGLLYLFFARVLWAVWSEVRTPKQRAIQSGMAQAGSAPAQQPAAQQRAAQPASPTKPMDRNAPKPAGRSAKQRKAPKGRGGRVARLVILEPKTRRGMTVALTGEITLGREEACTITIDDDSYVSQLHLRVYDYEGQPMLEDLGSTNGTFHNGNKISGVKLLHPGDRIQVGTTVIEAQ